jgi:hypothetical protein
MWKSGISRFQLSQNIQRLQARSKVPEMPTENEISLRPGLPRHLTIERESEIASNLAFLSATTDDPLKVMAVCVEEDDDGEGMTIRIASNTGDLSKIVDGFKALGEILEQAARRGLRCQPSSQPL